MVSYKYEFRTLGHTANDRGTIVIHFHSHKYNNEHPQCFIRVHMYIVYTYIYSYI